MKRFNLQRSHWLKRPVHCTQFTAGFGHVTRGRGHSEVGVQSEGVVRGARHHAHPLVLADPLLKEVGLSLQRDVLHEVEGVLHPVDLQRTTGQASQPTHAETSRRDRGQASSVGRLRHAAAGLTANHTFPVSLCGGAQPPSSAEVRTPAPLIITRLPLSGETPQPPTGAVTVQRTTASKPLPSLTFY